MKHITVREFKTIEEMEQSHELLKLLYPNNFSLDDYRSLLSEMTKGSYTQVVALDHDKVIGVAGLTVATKIWSGRYMDMDHFVVDRSYRSKGIGTLMLSRVKQLSEEENCKILSCDVYSENFNAQRLYMNEEFVPRGFHFIHIHDKSLDLKARD
jgi:ribosomal protein S18 acetylase RimI-like enzyme